MTSTKSLIWTRSIADWQDDAATILTPVSSNLVIHIPCLELAASTPKLKNFSCDYVIFTSANAVRFGLAVPEIDEAVRGARGIFTHGEATAAALKTRGLTPIVAPVRTAAELSEWLETKLPPQAALGLPCAAEPAWPGRWRRPLRGQRSQAASWWVILKSFAGLLQPVTAPVRAR